MGFKFNSIPALSKESLEIMENLKNQIRTVKRDVYGENCNNYEHSPEFYPKNMTSMELERRLHDTIPNEVLKKIAAEERKLRSMVDYNQAKTVITQILPQIAHPKTLFEYDLYVAARDMHQIDSTTDPRRGRKDKQTHMMVLPVEEWPYAWEEYVFLDKRADSKDMEKYMPEGTNCLLSTVHRFYAVKESGGIHRKRNGKNKNHNNGFLPGYEIEDSRLQIDWRTKSGAEFSWKIIPYLTGLEDKPGETRENILDLAGVRMILDRRFEESSIELYKYFMSRYKGDCEGSLILQILDRNQDRQINELLNRTPVGLKGFISKVVLKEDRSGILSPEDIERLQKRYYMEMLIPFSVTSSCDGVSGKNIIDTLTYPLETFKKIHEKRDDFIYKGRAEDWRSEHYTYLEWYLLNMLAPALLTGDSLRYIKSIADSKTGKRLKQYFEV